MNNPPNFNGGSVNDYHVFCAGKYVGVLTKFMMIFYSTSPETRDPVFYNKAFIYHREAKKGQPQWWRADGTPYPKEQVPKAYLGMSLLIT
ncbi:MAG TPA: hypothetical protein VM783_07810 [Candidatus Acidoferrum sp.]|nr:hypothetical protein [Candidatus Acidoferrum sp.]